MEKNFAKGFAEGFGVDLNPEETISVPLTYDQIQVIWQVLAVVKFDEPDYFPPDFMKKITILISLFEGYY